ncbi:MAG: hypothetical protein WCB68_07110 [Pyrinomonadaceae bacterium]
MATSKKKKLVVGSDPPIVITGGGGGPGPFGPFVTTAGVEVEFTDAAGRKVKFKPKHGGAKITNVTLTVDVVKDGLPQEEQFLFDSQSDYRISIRFFTDTPITKKSGSASTKKGSKKGSKRAGR